MGSRTPKSQQPRHRSDNRRELSSSKMDSIQPATLNLPSITPADRGSLSRQGGGQASGQVSLSTRTPVTLKTKDFTTVKKPLLVAEDDDEDQEMFSMPALGCGSSDRKPSSAALSANQRRRLSSDRSRAVAMPGEQRSSVSISNQSSDFSLPVLANKNGASAHPLTTV